MIFQVYVRGKDVALEVDKAAGTLEAKGRSTTAKTQVQSQNFADMPPPTNIDGKPRYNVNGLSLSYADAAPHFTHTGYLLAFEFDQACDPDVNYRLTIGGISIDGRPILMPTVDFAPFSETVPSFD